MKLWVWDTAAQDIGPFSRNIGSYGRRARPAEGAKSEKTESVDNVPASEKKRIDFVRGDGFTIEGLRDEIHRVAYRCFTQSSLNWTCLIDLPSGTK